jgi:hypothetical protein
MGVLVLRAGGSVIEGLGNPRESTTAAGSAAFSSTTSSLMCSFSNCSCFRHCDADCFREGVKKVRSMLVPGLGSEGSIAGGTICVRCLSQACTCAQIQRVFSATAQSCWSSSSSYCLSAALSSGVSLLE